MCKKCLSNIKDYWLKKNQKKKEKNLDQLKNEKNLSSPQFLWFILDFFHRILDGIKENLLHMS